MKKLLQIYLMLLVTFYFGQSASDFQYILVPQKFKNEKANKYELNQLLASQLKAKKFTVLNDALSANADACYILDAEITDTSNMFTNKIRIDFKDCNDKTVTSLEGKSNIKEFEEGMRDALQNAAKKLAVSNPVKNNLMVSTIKAKELPQNSTIEKFDENKKVITEKPKTVSKTTATPAKNDSYTNGLLDVVKVQLVSGEFILMNPNTFKPYATFKPSAKKDVFRVQMEDGSNTLGYTEAGKITIEVPTSEGGFKNEVFSKK